MNLIRYLVFTALMLVSHSVFAAAPVFGTDAENKYAREIAPPPGKSLVYIYQRDRDGSGVTPKIWLNNYEIGRLVPGTFTVWQLAPGQLDIRVDGTQPANLSIISEAGKVYLIRVSVVQTAAGPEPELTSLPASYRSDMIATQLIKNPRSLTSVASTSPAKQTPPPAQSVTQAQPTPQTESKPASESVKRSSSSTPTYTPGNMSLLIKTGALTLSSETQTILGNDWRFDDSASGIYDIELYYQFDSGLTVGGELIGYSAEFTTLANTDKHTVDVLILMGNAKQYFRPESSFQPYIGAGIGVATADVSGPSLSGSTSGLAYQAMAGIEYRGENFGVTAEYKFISADTEDSAGQKVDVSGSGIFAGIAIHF